MVPVIRELRADGAVDVALRGILRNVQGVDGAGNGQVDLGRGQGFALVVGLALDLQRVARVLERGHQGAGEVQVPEGLSGQELPGGVPAPGGCVGDCRSRNEGVHLRGVVIRRERYSDLVQDGRLKPGPRHVCAQVDAAHGRSNGCIHLRGAGQGGQQGVDLSLRVRIAGQAQREVVVLQGDAQGSVEVPVPNRVGAHQQVPGGLPGPRLGVGQVCRRPWSVRPVLR